MDLGAYCCTGPLLITSVQLGLMIAQMLGHERAGYLHATDRIAFQTAQQTRVTDGVGQASTPVKSHLFTPDHVTSRVPGLLTCARMALAGDGGVSRQL